MGNWVVGIILGPNIKIRGSRITLAYFDITIMKIGSGAEAGQHSKEGYPICKSFKCCPAPTP